MTAQNTQTQQDPSNAPRSRTIRYRVFERDTQTLFARPGFEQLRAVPDESHANPIGSVHDGFFSTVLATASSTCLFVRPDDAS